MLSDLILLNASAVIDDIDDLITGLPRHYPSPSLTDNTSSTSGSSLRSAYIIELVCPVDKLSTVLVELELKIE